MDPACGPHYTNLEMYILTQILLTVGNHCLLNEATRAWLAEFTNIAILYAVLYTVYCIVYKHRPKLVCTLGIHS